MRYSIFAIVILALFLLSCGQLEREYDKLNYESLTNETGDIFLYSGGVLVGKYRDAKIVYSDSDSRSIWFKHKGKKYYFQGDCLIKIK